MSISNQVEKKIKKKKITKAFNIEKERRKSEKSTANKIFRTYKFISHQNMKVNIKR